MEDVQGARSLPIELREKLLGLDYRVRKCLGRYGQHADDCRDDDDEEDEGGNQCCVSYHKEGIPESLDKLRIVGASFTFDIDDLKRARRKRRLTQCQSTVHSVILDPPVVELSAGLKPLPRVKVLVCFSIAKVASTHRLYRKAPVGMHGVHTLGVNLLLKAFVCDEYGVSAGREDQTFSDAGDDTDEACSNLDSDDGRVDDACSDDGGESDDGRCNLDFSDEDCDAEALAGKDDAWHVPTVVGFAASQAFDGQIDAENENGQVKRWWDQKEHSRQRATVPLSSRLVHPRGPFARQVGEGRSILDLQRCVPKKLNLDALWKAEGCSRSSAQELWALFSPSLPKAAVATPLGRRRHASHAPRTSLEKVSTCSDVVKIIAAFTLEPRKYTFDADIHFGLGLCNF